MHVLERAMHISTRNHAYVMIPLFLDSHDRHLSTTGCFMWSQYLLAKIFTNHWWLSKHCKGFVGHCTSTSRSGRERATWWVVVSSKRSCDGGAAGGSTAAGVSDHLVRSFLTKFLWRAGLVASTWAGVAAERWPSQRSVANSVIKARSSASEW